MSFVSQTQLWMVIIISTCEYLHIVYINIDKKQNGHHI